jgi:hypothetical protein
MMTTSTPLLDLAINTVVLGISLAGAISAGINDGTASATGNVTLYGDSSVVLASPITVSATGGAAASLNGGISASVNAIAASLNGIVASVNATYSVTIAGISTTVVGDSEVVVASRAGKCAIEGASIQIGKCTDLTMMGFAYKSAAAGKQSATSRIDMRADDVVSIEPGTATDNIQGTPTKITATKLSVRAETKQSALTLGSSASLYSGQALVDVDSSGARLVWSFVPIKTATNLAVAAAEKIWKAAYETADAAKTTVDFEGVMSVSALIGATAAAIGNGITSAVTEEGSEGAGIGAGASAAAAILTPAVALGVAKVVQKILTSRAATAAKKLADTAYQTAVKTAGTVEEARILVAAKSPTSPKVEVSSAGVTLSVGLSKIAITTTGIDITTGPMLKVTINGHPFTKSIPTFEVD